jgi:uncharacterized protein (DUF58 family)
VKLTGRGKDFLKAALAGTIAATVIDIRIILALCFSLMVVAIISGMLLARTSTSDLEITPSIPHIECFKNDEVEVRLLVRSDRRRFVSATLTKVMPPSGLNANIDDSDPKTFTLKITPRYAGRFSGLSGEFELNDPLWLFSKKIKFTCSNFVMDCYPTSLLKEIRAMRPISVALGEREGGTHGIGLEFYSLDDYRGSTERKNIFWKKVASMPDERLLVKTRESNIPKTLSISLLRTDERDYDSLVWIDSACEGVALIGKLILQIGCDVEILFVSEGQVVSRVASNVSELSEAVMDMSAFGGSNLDNASLLLSKSDICVTGFREIQNALFASVVARKPSLLIEDAGAAPSKIGELAVIYRPDQDLSALVNRVVGL